MRSLDKTMRRLRVFIFLLSFSFLTPFFTTISSAQEGGISGINANGLELDDDDNYLYEKFEPLVKDPYEKYNRWMFRVNDKIYRKVFSPLAKGYDFLIPKRIQKCINNVARWAATPKRFVNNLLQRKVKSATIEVGRLAINSTIGIGGLFDAADHFFKLEQQTEDFGQTLGFYGIGSGPYIMWPIIGPSTARDGVGFAGDHWLSPSVWLNIYDVEPDDGYNAFGYVKRVNNYPYNIKGAYNKITEGAIDPYIALQNAYIQNRNKRIAE